MAQPTVVARTETAAGRAGPALSGGRVGSRIGSAIVSVGARGRSDRDHLDDAHAVLGEHGYTLNLERTLAGWNALVYPLDDRRCARRTRGARSDGRRGG
jgi:hypothetical protein